MNIFLVIFFLALNEFMHGFSMSYLSMFTAGKIFGRDIRINKLFSVCSGVIISAAAVIKVYFKLSFDLSIAMGACFIIILILEWILFTEKSPDSFFSLIFAMIFSDSIIFAVGNIIFALTSAAGLSGKSDYMQIIDYILIYTLSIMYIIMLYKITGFREKEKMPMISMILISLIVCAVSQISSDDHSLRELTEEVNIHDMTENSLIFLSISLLIIFMIKTTQSRYLEKINHLNEEYLNIQAQHFETVRSNDTEIRRINHDMRNHVFCMNELYRRGDYSELGKYLEKLNHTVSNAQASFKTGNGIADAIISEKAAANEKYNVHIDTEGDFGILDIPAYDMCTILANLLDNALEAASYFCVKNRNVHISCRATENFAVLSIENCTANLIDVSSSIKTLKPEKESHGFGLQNIRNAVSKLGGELILNCEPYEGEFKFTAEVIFPLCNINRK